MSVHRSRPNLGDRGQVTPLIAITAVVMAGIGVVIVAVGGVVADRAAAQTAADAAALAAAAHDDEADGNEAAARFAAVNGATLISVQRHAHRVEVEVRVGRATARARAEMVIGPVRSVRGSIP